MFQVYTDVILVEANILYIYYFSDVVACISNPKGQHLGFSNNLDTQKISP